MPSYLTLPNPPPELMRILAPTGDRLWLVTSRRLGRQVLAEDRFSRALAVAPQAPANHPLRPEPTALTSLDPPDHGRLRGLVSHAFTPPAVAALESTLRQTARELLAGKRAADLVPDYLMVLAATAICRVLGIPWAEQDRFSALADRAHGITPCSPEESAASREELRAYVAGLVADGHYEADTSLLGTLRLARQRDAALTIRELASLVELLLDAGYETTIGQTSLAVLALLEHPEQWRFLVNRPEHVPGAVEELLRYAPVVPISFTRVARHDTELAGERIRAGEAVLVSLLHANFDPREHPDPDVLRVDRRTARHLTFGHGPHVCLGARLARLQMRIALEELIRVAPHLSLEADPADLGYRPPEAVVRGPTSLPASW
ncbi:cytochrome P450 [Streptomyces violaceusniger]|uniref:Cytochrome P450 n=1 Tax=Streptomyces violaceusniger TaxID=68280 RepID=A0A4D4KMH5_STRVO|nr:cytochrome P450 [Streptomyces violaceusniger]